MRNNQNQEDFLSQKLDKFDYDRRLLFGLLICKNLLPYYEYYAKLESNNSYEKMKKLFNNIIHSNSLSNVLQVEILEDCKVTINLLTPDLESYETIFANYAIETCGAILEIINFIIYKSKEKLLNLSTMSSNVLFSYILEAIYIVLEKIIATESFEERIRFLLETTKNRYAYEFTSSHSLLEKEFEFQLNLMEYIVNLKDNFTIVDIVKSYEIPKIVNLDLMPSFEVELMKSYNIIKEDFFLALSDVRSKK